MPALPTIVSICGPSGSGKSHLAKAVAEALGPDRCTRIPTDYFLLLPAHPPSSQPVLALGWDWALLDEVLAEPPGTPVTTPDVDFDGLVRRAPSGGLPFVVRPVMLTDALAPHPAASFRILLTAPASIRRARVAARDVKWNSRVIDRWASLEHAWTEVAATQPAWDSRVDGGRPISHNAARVAERLTRWMRGRHGAE